jgi:hypothetical protein
LHLKEVNDILAHLNQPAATPGLKIETIAERFE